MHVLRKWDVRGGGGGGGGDGDMQSIVLCVGDQLILSGHNQ